MDKKQLSERDICSKFITPAILQSGWTQSQFREEVKLTDGRVAVRGTIASRIKNPEAKGGPKRADYVLYAYTTRHTFVAWSLCIRQGLNKLVDLMGHASKRMIYEVYGKYVKGLEKDRRLILEYFGRDYLSSKNDMTLDSQTFGESFSESQGSYRVNHLL